MRTSHDSMGGYEWSMLLLHLAQNRRVNGRMAALSIFQVALKFIAEAGLSRQGQHLPIFVFILGHILGRCPFHERTISSMHTQCACLCEVFLD